MKTKLLTRFLISSLIVILIFSLVGCATRTKSSRSARDGAPRVKPSHLDKVPDAVPKFEPLSKGGNRYKKSNTYVEKKKRYKVMSTSRGYKEHGQASWYGTKFHGRKTSSGERYNMYEMTAAHRTLPLPTYARVTNLVNGKSVIVKVNDRGPFHKNRLIDLSYVAAHKLDMLGSGTTKVKVESVDPRDHGRYVHKKGGSLFSRLKKAPKEQAPVIQAPAVPIVPAISTKNAKPSIQKNRNPKIINTPKNEENTEKNSVPNDNAKALMHVATSNKTSQVVKTHSARTVQTQKTSKKQSESASNEIYVPDDKIVQRAKANSKAISKASTGVSTAASTAVSKSASTAISKIASATAGTAANKAASQKIPTIKDGKKQQRYYLQMGSFSQKAGAEKLVKKLVLLSNVPSQIKEGKNQNHPIFRVRVGPLYSQQDVERLSKKLKQPQMPAAVVIME